MDIVLLLVAILSVLGITAFIIYKCRYKTCPNDKILVVYGMLLGKNEDGTPRVAKVIHSGGIFVIPLLQGYNYLDLSPISIQINLFTQTKQSQIKLNAQFTVAVSSEEGVVEKAAEHFIGLSPERMNSQFNEMLSNLLRFQISKTDIGEIDADRHKFIKDTYNAIESELKSTGLRLVSFKIFEITDSDGYIISFGK